MPFLTTTNSRLSDEEQIDLVHELFPEDIARLILTQAPSTALPAERFLQAGFTRGGNPFGLTVFSGRFQDGSCPYDVMVFTERTGPAGDRFYAYISAYLAPVLPKEQVQPEKNV
ncbi:MAG: hypothetical protein V1659_02530 [Candidatus Woesearchaeota archaeon]